MNKKNLKHAFKKAWQDLKTFWAKIFDKIKRDPKKEVTKKSKFLRLVLSLLSLTLIFAISHKNCNTALDNQGSVLTVNAEEDIVYNLAYLQSLYPEDTLVEYTYVFPFTDTYTDITNNGTYVFRPVYPLTYTFCYNVNKGAFIAYKYSDYTIDDNNVITDLSYYHGFPEPISEIYGDIYTLPRLVYFCDDYNNTANGDFFTFEFNGCLSIRNINNLIPLLEDGSFKYGLTSLALGRSATNLIDFVNLERSNIFLTPLQSFDSFGIPSPFAWVYNVMGYMSDNVYNNYTFYNGRRAWAQDVVIRRYFTREDGTIFSQSFTSLNQKLYSSLYDIGEARGRYDFSYVAYYSGLVAGDLASYENGYNAGYNEGLEQGYQNGYDVGYGDGLSSGTSGYQDGYNAGVSYAETELKPQWQEEAKQQEYDRIETELKPQWQEEAKQQEYDRIILEDKPRWEQQAYTDGYNAGVGSTSSSYQDGYNAGYNYAETYMKPKWVEAEYNRIVQYVKPYWDTEAKNEERDYIETELRPVWERDAYNLGYNEGLDANGVDFNPLKGLENTMNTLFSVPMFGQNISIGILFTIAMGIILFVAIIKIFFGG